MNAWFKLRSFFFLKSVELLKKANLCRKFGKFASSFILSSQANETPVSCFDPATVLEHFHNSTIPKKHSNKQQQQKQKQKIQFLRSPKLAEFQLSSSKYCNINNNYRHVSPWGKNRQKVFVCFYLKKKKRRGDVILNNPN